MIAVWPSDPVACWVSPASGRWCWRRWSRCPVPRLPPRRRRPSLCNPPRGPSGARSPWLEARGLWIDRLPTSRRLADGLAVGPGNHGSEHVLVPTFVGTAPATPVAPGRYQFAVSSTAPAPLVFTTFTVPFTVTSAVTAPGRFVAVAPTPDGGAGTGWRSRVGASTASVTPGSRDRFPASASSPRLPSWGSRATPDGGGYGSWRPTVGCSPSVTPGSRDRFRASASCPALPS